MKTGTGDTSVLIMRLSSSVSSLKRFAQKLGLISVFLYAGAAVAADPFVQPTDAELADLDAQIQAYMDENNIPGGLVAVSSNGTLIHQQAYGMANVELSVPVNGETVFEIGSISKQFVAAAVMLLVQEDKLGLEDTIHQHLQGLPSEWLGVTVRQLLTHTSGIPDYEEIASYDVYGSRLTSEDVIKIAHSRPMDFEPGTGWYYSNTGYYLLSLIVERIEGQPLGEILESRIFDPLDMTQTRMTDPEAIIPNRASGYWVNKAGKLINRRATETSSTLGAGGILSSASDLAKWDKSLYGDQLLTAESKAAMWAPTVLSDGRRVEYGFGWNVDPYAGLTSQRHSGQVAGFVAKFGRFPDQEAAIIVFMNRYEVDSGYPMRAVLHTFMPGIGPVPESR